MRFSGSARKPGGKRKQQALTRHFGKSHSPRQRHSMVQSNSKLQISNGYLFESDQLSRVLHFLTTRQAEKRIYRKDIEESTGLSNRQIESVVSIGCALGLIKPAVQILTTTGTLIVEHDIFLEQTGTLQWCHYQGAGNSRNLVWYEIFNRILPSELAYTESGWLANLRNSLSGQYTDRTIGKHLQQEVRFVIDAYLNRNFKKLEILQQHSDGRLYRRRHLHVEPPILCAMIYDYAAGHGESLLQVREIAEAEGSPSLLFGFDETTFRQAIEPLHENGWLRYESTHNLDQIRLKEDYSAAAFLKRYYEDPVEKG